MIDLKKLGKAKPLPPRILIYSAPKMGKSTWASQAPGIVFLDIEKGLGALDVPVIDIASFDDVLEGVKALWEQDHSFTSLAIDSLDWLAPLIVEHVIESHNKENGTRHESIDKLGSFGAGYVEVDKAWKRLFDGLDYLRRHKGMTIILIAHAETKTATPTDSDPYDYSAIKLAKRTAALVSEWCDVIGYISQPKVNKKAVDDPNAKKPKVISTRAVNAGERVLCLGHNPAYVTGNRYNLPDQLPLDWESFEQALKGE